MISPEGISDWLCCRTAQRYPNSLSDGGATLCLESEIGARPPPASGVTFLFFSLALSSPNRKSLHRLQRIVQMQTQAFFPHKAHTELGRSHKRLTGNFP